MWYLPSELHVGSLHSPSGRVASYRAERGIPTRSVSEEESHLGAVSPIPPRSRFGLGCRRRSGFTLLETILAVGLSALLIALIAAGMRIYTNIVQDGRADVVNARVARTILQRIASDLRSAYTVTEEEDSSSSLGADPLAADGGLGAIGGTATAGTGTDTGAADVSADATAIDTTVDLTGSTVQQTPGVYGNQFELQVDVLGRFSEPVRYDMITSMGGDPLASNLLSEPKVITYYVRAATSAELAGTPLESTESNSRESMSILARRIQSRAVAVNSAGLGMADTQTGEQMLSDQVVAIQFQYHDGYDWTDTWDTSTAGLPIAVKITLTIADAADESYDTVEMNSDNTFEMTVRIPTAEAVSTEDTSTTSL